MAETPSLPADKLKRVEAGMTEYQQTLHDLSEAYKLIDELKTKLHLSNLDNEHLKKVILDTKDAKDIMEGERDEAISYRIAYETHHAINLKLLMDFKPPTKVLSPIASKVGEEAVRQVTEIKND